MNTVPSDGSATPTPPQTTPQQPASVGGPLGNSNALSPDSGVWVGVALFAGIMLSGTRAAPIVTGLLGVALIYQLQLLLSGK